MEWRAVGTRWRGVAGLVKVHRRPVILVAETLTRVILCTEWTSGKENSFALHGCVRWACRCIVVMLEALVPCSRCTATSAARADSIQPTMMGFHRTTKMRRTNGC